MLIDSQGGTKNKQWECLNTHRGKSSGCTVTLLLRDQSAEFSFVRMAGLIHKFKTVWKRRRLRA